MKKEQTISTETIKTDIQLSIERSKTLGIDPDKRNKDQVMLSPAELSQRCRQNAELLDVVLPQFDEFYNLLSPNDFFIAVADSEGYILHIRGSSEIIEASARRNCVPGYRWTEKDVGTSAIALCLRSKKPVQLVRDEHFFKQAHGLTSSAAPILGKDKSLLGIIAVSGAWEKTHPHTLYMVVTAARAAEQRLRVLRRNKDLEANLNFLDQVISSSKNGLLIINNENHIWRVNQRGAMMLGRNDLEGSPLSSLKGLEINLDDVQADPDAWGNKECRIKAKNRTIDFIYSVQPVTAEDGERLGAVIFLEEVKDVYRMAHTIAGTQAHYTFDSIAGSSPGFLEAVKLARRAATSQGTVLLQGETGTGKELFAQAIHNLSDRRGNPFIPINCGAIPSNLLESELFGYVAGTFTGASTQGRPGKFELANTGTILLDEIGDMPYKMQVKLLRVVQTGEVYRIGADKPVTVDTRIIASTHINMPRAIKSGRFREDLFYRLNVFPITIPPLKERGEADILALARLFLSENSKFPPELGPGALDALTAYHWPGNVRELENCIQRAIHLNEGGILDASHLGLPAGSSDRPAHTGTLDEMTRKMIIDTLAGNGSNMASTAKILGISRATLYRKVNRYGIRA